MIGWTRLLIRHSRETNFILCTLIQVPYIPPESREPIAFAAFLLYGSLNGIHGHAGALNEGGTQMSLSKYVIM